MSEQVSVARLYLLRGWYLGISAFLGFLVWPKIIAGGQGWEPLPGVAMSFWAALSAFCLLGLRYPLAMLPLLFLELSYKFVWLLAVWLPLQLAGSTNGMRLGTLDLDVAAALFVAVVVGLLVTIPWPYAVARFVRTRGDTWKGSVGTPLRETDSLVGVAGSS